MEVRKRAIRIGALGAMLFATSSMVFNGIAGAEPAKPHPGHVHIDTHMKAAKGKKDIKLDRQCSVLLRPHDYRGFGDGDVTFTFDAHGKKPTPSTDPIPVRVGDPLVYDTTPSWN